MGHFGQVWLLKTYSELLGTTWILTGICQEQRKSLIVIRESFVILGLLLFADLCLLSSVEQTSAGS